MSGGDCLKVHVFGGGFGESIVLEMPGGRWGVVDSYCERVGEPHDSPNTTNPALEFLKEKKVETLEFLTLTHPHEDHCRGHHQLMKRFDKNIKFVLMHHGHETKVLVQYLGFMRRHHTVVERALGQAKGSYARVMSQVLDRTRTWSDHKRSKGEQPLVQRIDATAKVFWKDVYSGLSIRAIAPTGEGANRYLLNLEREAGGGFASDWDPARIDHNRISLALHVQFGKTAILLGGDVPSIEWREVESMLDGNDPSGGPGEHFHRNYNLVKISHHGSLRSQSQAMLDAGRGRKMGRIAVVTPYDRLEDPLPHHDGLKLLAGWFDEIHLTRLDRVKTIPLDQFERPDFKAYYPNGRSDDFFAILERFPDHSKIWSAQFWNKPGPLDPKLPGELIGALEQRGLSNLIPPRYRRDEENLSRVSFAFNDQGEEIIGDRYIGPCTGRFRS